MDELQTSVANVIRQTRPKLLPFWGNIDSKSKGGGPADVVTRLDLDIEKFLIEELGKLEPTIPFAGEEFGGSREAGRFWLCDPIDGTAHFVRGMPFCTVMLALIEEQKVTRSFIYDFVNDDLYHAQLGKGAFKNEAPISVSEREYKDSYIGWETRGYNGDGSAIYLELKERAVPMKTVTSGFEFAMIASGKLEGRIMANPFGKDYDFAPGSLLVAEAGGVVANIGKRTYDYRNLDFIAANPKVFKSLTEGPDAFFPIGE